MEKVVTRRKLRCFSCRKVAEHTIERKNVGTIEFPIYSYKTTCQECKTTRYFPKEPEISTEIQNGK